MLLILNFEFLEKMFRNGSGRTEVELLFVTICINVVQLRRIKALIEKLVKLPK